MKNIVLMGFMGAGKTTVGKCLAKELACELIDTDEWIENAQKRKISEIFAQDGEQLFRDLETQLLKELQMHKEMFVLSVGGGMPVRVQNRELLRALGTVVYLKTSKEEILRRVAGDNSRPLLQGGSLEEKITLLMEQRETIYKETAHVVMTTDGKNKWEVADELKQFL